MSKDERKIRSEKADERCDRRTADFVARQLEGVEHSLADVVPDIMSLGRYEDTATVGWCLQVLKRLKGQYRKLADGHSWNDEEPG